MPTLDYLTGFNHRVVAGIVGDSANASIETVTVRRTGGTSVKFAATTAQARWVEATTGASLKVGVCYVQYTTLPSGDCPVLLFGGGSNGSAGVAYSSSNGQVAVVGISVGGVMTLSNVGGPVLSTGVWYRIETRVNAAANPWLIDVQIAVADGAASALTQGSAAFAADTMTQWMVGGTNLGSGGAVTQTSYFTDVAVSNQTGDYPLGPVTVHGYSPNAVGTHSFDAATSAYFFKEVATVDTALTTSETTSYETIDDVPLDQDVDAIWVGTTTGSPNTPAFRSAGTTTFSANNVTNTSLTPGTPGTKSVGDLLVLVAACSSNANTVSTPSGWNLVSGFPKASGTSVGGKVYVFTRIADGTATDVPAVTFGSMTTGTSGTPGAVVILVYQNGTETLDGTLPTLVDTTATTLTTIPAFTTGTNNSMVIGIAMKMQDLAQTSTVATFTERVDQSTTNAVGWVLEVSDKVQTTLGSSGTAAVTWSSSTSGRTLAISLGFKSSRAVVQPTNTWYAEHAFADESTLTSAPLGVRAWAAQNLDTATSSTWAAKLYDGTNTEDISNSSISSNTKAYVGKTFSQRPNTGGAWTLVALNAATIRFGYTAAATGHPRLEAAMLEAAFTPAATRSFVITTRTARNSLLRR